LSGLSKSFLSLFFGTFSISKKISDLWGEDDNYNDAISDALPSSNDKQFEKINIVMHNNQNSIP